MTSLFFINKRWQTRDDILPYFWNIVQGGLFRQAACLISLTFFLTTGFNTRTLHAQEDASQPLFNISDSLRNLPCCDRFKQINLTVPVNNVFEINSCIKNYVDLSSIKRSFPYRDKLICVSSTGGFACLNVNDFSLDSLFTAELNSDLFTDAQFYNDTLFGELFNELYYWNGSWQKYTGSQPIDIFSIIYEDDSLAVCSENKGECDAFLVFFNKYTHELKYYFNPEISHYAKSIIKYKNYLFVTTDCYHLEFHGSCYFLKNIHKLKNLPVEWLVEFITYDQYLERAKTYYDESDNWKGRNDSDFSIPYSFNFEYNPAGGTLPSEYVKSKILNGSFLYNDRFYHIVDDRQNDWTALTTIVNDTLTLIDTFSHLSLNTIIDYNGLRVLNEKYTRGLAVIRNDTIFNIDFDLMNPEKNDFRIENTKVFPLSGNKWNIRKHQYASHPEKNEPRRSVKVKYGDYTIVAHHDGGLDGNYIFHDDEKVKLRLTDDWNFINTIFTYNNRLFLYFTNLGNWKYKYWLIEITDIQKFASIYGESEI